MTRLNGSTRDDLRVGVVRVWVDRGKAGADPLGEAHSGEGE